MAAAFGVGLYTFFGGAFASVGPNVPVERVTLFVLGVPATIPLPATRGELFLALSVLYALLFLMAMRGRSEGLRSVIGRTLRGDVTALFRNSASTVAVGYAALSVIIAGVEWVQTSTGLPTGGLTERDPLEGFLLVSLAPLVEELGFRVSIIGLASLAAVLTRMPAQGAIRVLWAPSAYLVQALPPREYRSVIGRLNWIVVLTALFFGLAHLLYGGGWQVGKVSLAVLAGLALGGVYVRYGFPGAVILHWAFNYFTSSFFYFERATGISAVGLFVEGLVDVAGLVALGGLLLVLALGLATRKLPRPTQGL
jgi:hypothetical protein